MNKVKKLRPYIDRGKPGTPRFIGGTFPTVRDPPKVPIHRLALEIIKRHNTLEPELEQTNRTFLRWSENEGSGLPNPDADTRETHYDPLPPDLQEKVSDIVDASPWTNFIRKLYRSSLTGKSLAQELGISRTQFYADRSCALWYFRGRFESERIYG